MDTSANSDDLKRFSWPESEAARVLGLSALTVQSLRRELLRQDEDWCKKKRAVHWTHHALKTVANALGVTEDAVSALREPAPGSDPPGPPPKEVKTFVVYNRKTANPHILLATDGKDLVRVRVRSKENFRPGMTVRCTLAEAPDLYTLEGNHPRFPGKY